jgi:DNA-binding transcriptional MerR regulator
LNVIVTLKAFGMTLAQIRTLLETKPPPLARVLQLQLQAGNARRDAADKAVGLVKAALATIASGKRLSLDNLCNLTRSMEMENQHARVQIVRELINETITPEEERAVMTWIAARSTDGMRLSRKSGCT